MKKQSDSSLNQLQQKIESHILNRNKLKKMWAEKGIQMLDKEELLLSDIEEPDLNPTQALVYDTMKNELIEMGYGEFRYLGQGVQGQVVLAKETSSNKRYAIKGIHFKDKKGKVNQDAYGQVKKEIETLKKCQGSPYVVNLLNQIEGKEFIYLVLTECLGTLKQIIENTNDEKLNELTAIKYSKDIAEGLYFIHSKNCLVNDLKMDNILIDYNGNAVVSDFGFAENLTKQSGYGVNQYMGNVACQAPECYNPSQYDLYFKEYKKLGLVVKQEPSSRSEACSLGYLMFTMISGFNFNLVFNKHQPLQYTQDFQNFVYQKQLKYIIDGLTQFIPRNRLSIKEILIILKGILSFEFQLDQQFNEAVVDKNGELQQLISKLYQGIEFVQMYSDRFYPIIHHEKSFLQKIDSKQNEKCSKEKEIIEQLQSQNALLNKEIEKLKENLSKIEKQQLNLDLFEQETKQNQQLSKVQKYIEQKGIVYDDGSVLMIEYYQEQKIGVVDVNNWNLEKMELFDKSDNKKQIGYVYNLKSNGTTVRVENNFYEVTTKNLKSYKCTYELF